MSEKCISQKIVHLQGISNPWLSLCLFNIVALDEQRQFDGKIGAEGWGRKLYLLRSTTPLLSGGSHNRNVNKLFIQWSPVKFWFLNSKYFPTFSSRRWHIFIFSVFSWNRMLHYSYNEKKSWTSELKFYSHLTWRVSVSSDFPISFVTFNPT